MKHPLQLLRLVNGTFLFPKDPWCSEVWCWEVKPSRAGAQGKILGSGEQAQKARVYSSEDNLRGHFSLSLIGLEHTSKLGPPASRTGVHPSLCPQCWDHNNNPSLKQSKQNQNNWAPNSGPHACKASTLPMSSLCTLQFYICSDVKFKFKFTCSYSCLSRNTTIPHWLLCSSCSLKSLLISGKPVIPLLSFLNLVI